MKIVLIGNYIKDRQESMLRFSEMLNNGFLREGYTSEIWQPSIVFGKSVAHTQYGFRKWVGYLDKWIVFPFVLRVKFFFNRQKYKNTFFHICDHSNAPYLAHLPRGRTTLTCHDVIAIKASSGFDESNVKVSYAGKFLQKWILKHLKNVKLLAAVSEYTLDQLKSIIGNEKITSKHWRVIYNALNAEFNSSVSESDEILLSRNGIMPDEKFILHVGSNHPRKNRKLLIDMLAIIEKQWDGKLCFAGERLTDEIQNYIASLGLTHRVISIEKPEHSVLTALYRKSEVFIFPSFAEGFGWPVIEAQACGTPVIASNAGPMCEVGGDAALYCDPTKPEDFVKAFNAIHDETKRVELIKKGFENCQRFSSATMIKEYENLFRENC